MSAAPASVGARVIEGKLHIVRRNRRKVVSETPAPPPPPRARPVRVARLLALAHQMQRLVEAGERPSVMAGRFGFSRARVSQLLDLVLLAPDLQAQILTMENEAGRDSITERDLRAVVRHRAWVEQRRAFDRLLRDAG